LRGCACRQRKPNAQRQAERGNPFHRFVPLQVEPGRLEN
jgi:hypothetical protein